MPRKITLDRWLAGHPLPGPRSTKDERAEYYAAMPGHIAREWEIRKARTDCENDVQYNSAIANRARKRMQFLDSLWPEMRAVVHDYNLEVVREFLNMGIRDTKKVRALIEGVQAGGRDRLFQKHGVYEARKISHLIKTVLHLEHDNGTPRFKLNKGPNSKRNPIDVEADDDDFVFVARGT